MSRIGKQPVSYPANVKVFLAEGTLGQPDLLDLGFVVLFTRRSLLVAFRVEFIWVLPVKWVSAGFCVRRDNSAKTRVPGAKRLLYRRKR